MNREQRRALARSMAAVAVLRQRALAHDAARKAAADATFNPPDGGESPRVNRLVQDCGPVIDHEGGDVIDKLYRVVRRALPDEGKPAIVTTGKGNGGGPGMGAVRPKHEYKSSERYKAGYNPTAAGLVDRLLAEAKNGTGPKARKRKGGK